MGICKREKVAVYSGTHNVYRQMYVAMSSLIANTQVNKIYLLLDGTPFPYRIPDNVKMIDVSNQYFISRDSVNYNNPWSYMVLLRVAYSKLFPMHDCILSLDIDTIVDQDISDIWDLPIDDYYYAMTHETHKSTDDNLYFNAGVMLMNLKKLRTDGMDEKLIYAVQTKKYPFCEQDCINEMCKGYVYDMPSSYNLTMFSEPIDDVKIIHYACFKDLDNRVYFKKYADRLKEQGLL